MVGTMLFLSHLRVARNNRDPADFCIAADAAAAAEMLSADRKGHSLLEFLHDHAITKLYLDHETYFEHEPTEAQRLELEAAVRGRTSSIISLLAAPGRPMSYRLATRHGYCPTRKMHKLSFRPFPQGMRLRYTDIPKVLQVADQHADGFWDMSVYKPREQLLACVHGAKGADDPRVLCPEHPDDDPLLYVAQHWDEAWPLLDLPPDYDAECDVGGTIGAGDMYPDASECDEAQVATAAHARALLACLSATTADDRAQWVRVATLLKRLSPAGALFPDFVAFSRKSAKFEGEADCRKTWDSLSTETAFGRASVGLGTLRFLAHRDDPVAYAALSVLVTAQPAPLTVFSDGELIGLLRKEIPLLFDRLEGPPGLFTRTGDCIDFNFGGQGYRIHLQQRELLVSRQPGDDIVGKLVPGAGIWEGPHLGFHPSIQPETNFKISTPDLRTTRLESTNPDDQACIEYRADKKSAHLKRVGCRKLEELKPAKTKQMMTQVEAAQRAHALQAMGEATYNAIMKFQKLQNCTFIANNYGGEGTDNAFPHMRIKMIAHASSHRHMKAGGHVYEPVPGCPCAYRPLCDYGEYINVALEDDPVFLANPFRFDQAMKFLKDYRPKQMPEWKPDRDLISFANGVVRLSTGEFSPAADIAPGHALSGKVARRHIDADYTGSAETPLLDTILDHQFTPEVAEVLCALLGRLLFRVGELDNWQVLLYLVGLGGTGKSVILEIVECFFEAGGVSNLANKREEIFGMANLKDKDIVMGRDMPHELSRVIPQTMMNSMTTGEGVEVAIKGTTTINMRWTAPIVMSSNHMPDYVNTGGALGRRLATVHFGNVVTKVNQKLLADIRAREIPAILCRILRDYHTVRERVEAADRGFWDAAPPKMLEWQGMLSAATNKLHAFLAMDEDERGCKIERVEGKIVGVLEFKVAFEATMKAPLKTLDIAILLGFGFTVTSNINVCKSCKQIAKARGGKCCAMYSQTNRVMRDVIMNMQLAPVCPVVALAEGDGEEE